MLEIINEQDSLLGRTEAIKVNNKHHVLGNPLKPPFDSKWSKAMFGMGCFWGAEKKFWDLDGIFTTAVGYSSGFTSNPTYHEVCSSLTGHNEVVLIVFDEDKIGYFDLLKIFWESHNPTQGMQQGNDIGTQYRSGIYTFSNNQLALAEQTKIEYQEKLSTTANEIITTEIHEAEEFFYAEDHHQQYLAKNINGYCGLGGMGVSYPTRGT